jgi:hypothetical protein
MRYSKGEVKKINQRLDMYEKILNEILRNTSIRKKDLKRSNEEECKIYLSFAGLNRVCEEEKIE